MKNIILSVTLLVILQCKAQKLEKDCNLNVNVSQIVEGYVDIEVENNSNLIRVPQEIDNSALIVTMFQRVIKEGSQYEDVKIPVIHFDCLNPCFPLTFKLKKGEKKNYNFNIFNPNMILKNSKYRIKLSMDNYFGRNCSNIKTEWIYFETK